MKCFGPKLKELRELQGKTQSQVSDYLNILYGQKTDRAMISKWETGFQTPRLETVAYLAQIFGVTVEYLIDDACPQNEMLQYSTCKAAKYKGVQIRVLGKVPAGTPFEAIEDLTDEYEDIDSELAKTGEFFALKIQGDTMEPRIMDKDIVIVRRQTDVENGEVAVVMVNGDDATVEKFVKHENGVSLVPTNPSHEPRFFTKNEVEKLPIRVVGKLIELRRRF